MPGFRSFQGSLRNGARGDARCGERCQHYGCDLGQRSTYTCICQNTVDKQFRAETFFSIGKVVQEQRAVIEVTNPLLHRLLASSAAQNTCALTYLVLVIAMYEMRYECITVSQPGPPLRYTWPNMEASILLQSFNLFALYQRIHNLFRKIGCGRFEAFPQFDVFLTLKGQVS